MHVTDIERILGTPSADFALITTAVSPVSGAATYALATDTKMVELTSLTAVAAEYCLAGYGISIADAEASRDASQIIVKAGVVKQWEPRPVLATHFSIKSVSGTPQVHYSQRV